jgi:DNA polymerase-3 subunit epsilon
MSHFTGSVNGKSIKMCGQVADVGYELTGSELIALLKESFEIKKFKPLYNRRQRRSLFRYELISYTDNLGYIRFELAKSDQGTTRPLACFTTKAEAFNFLNRMIEKYSLCQKLCGVYPTDGNCFHYEIGACKGACIGKEPPGSYNMRAGKAISGFEFGIHNLLIIDTGRNEGEKSAVKIENGRFLGFGYFTAAYIETDQEIVHDCIQTYPDNREVQQIIKQYLRNNKVDRVIVY